MEGLTKSTLMWRGSSGIPSSGVGSPPCKVFTVKRNGASVALTWEDPDDITVDGSTKALWKYTQIVRKIGSYPKYEDDGTVVTRASVRNQYKDSPYVDSDVTIGVTYYYAAFTCSVDGVFNAHPLTGKITPTLYKVMTVKIDLNNSNPATCGSYADDAVGMTEGKTSQDWADFFGYKPCLFKNGAVVGYLNPDDYTKFEDGTSADITSGNAGDVMVEFPRRGLKISKSGSIITVSMTNNPDDSSFKYYAHQRGTTQKDYFYVGAYLGYNSSNKLRSLSGKTPTAIISLSTCRTYAGNLGSGYMNVGFYQFLFLQCMYLLQYKGNLNSQTAHGYGYCDAGSSTSTGATNTNGMMYGSTSGTDHVKLFGIEDFWGNLCWWLDGYYTNSSYYILTATDGFNNTGSGYTDQGTLAGTSNHSGWISDVTGTTETGFTPKTHSGSSSTYFCDGGGLNFSCVPYVGGDWDGTTIAGAFQFNVYYDLTGLSSTVGGRLGYL